MYKAIIFDLDGTLLDSAEDIADSMNMVLKERGLEEHPIESYNHFVGSGAGILVKRSLPDEHLNEKTVNECLKRFKEIYRSNWNIKSRLYDGISDMLDGLTEKDVPFAIFSNKPNDFVQLCVAEYLDGYNFSSITGHTDEIKIKPDPAGALIIADEMNIQPGNIIFVGDTGVDMETAINAGMLPVGVPWGFRPDELADSGAEKIISHPTDLLSLV